MVYLSVVLVGALLGVAIYYRKRFKEAKELASDLYKDNYNMRLNIDNLFYKLEYNKSQVKGCIVDLVESAYKNSTTNTFHAKYVTVHNYVKVLEEFSNKKLDS